MVRSWWGGYGQILRVHLEGCSAAPPTVVVKRVAPPRDEGGISHERKCKSYKVEQAFYETCAAKLDPMVCRVPTLLCSDNSTKGETLFVLEDLDAPAAGFDGRRHSLDLDGARACVSWLAHFHRAFLGARDRPGGPPPPAGLWDQGCYWHLATRPDEHAAMDRRDPLRENATGLDALLRGAQHQTLLHGDAKLANFCWRRRGGDGGGPPVAAVDFQYCGWGVGVLDVAYCLGAFPGVDRLDLNGPQLLDLYFSELGAGPEVEAEWRALHCVAVADFERFLAGWAGSSWRRSGFVGEKVAEAIALVQTPAKDKGLLSRP